MARQDYSVAQVAALLLLCGELYMRAHAPKGWRPDDTKGPIPKRSRFCRECGKAFRYTSSEDICDDCRENANAPTVHADVLQRLRLSGGDWETLTIALADLDVAMRRLSPYHRAGVGQFVALGPLALEEHYVEFRVGHAPHVISLWRSMNGMGEFTEERKSA